MWDYIQDDLTSVVLIDEKTNTLTIKIYGLGSKDSAETFAQYTMSLLQFDYNSTGYSMPSKNDTLDMDIKIPYTPRKHQAFGLHNEKIYSSET